MKKVRKRGIISSEFCTTSICRLIDDYRLIKCKLRRILKLFILNVFVTLILLNLIEKSVKLFLDASLDKVHVHLKYVNDKLW